MLHAATHLFAQGFQFFATPYRVRCRFRVQIAYWFGQTRSLLQTRLEFKSQRELHHPRLCRKAAVITKSANIDIIRDGLNVESCHV
jgi:hypothetical protein